MANKEMLTNVDIIVGITEVKTWSSESVQRFCESRQYYTAGDNDKFSRMLNRVNKTRPTIDNIYNVARNIVLHSEEKYLDGAGIPEMMMMLNSSAILTTYEIAEEVVTDETDEPVYAKYRESRKVTKPEPEATAKTEPKPEVKEAPKPEAKAEAKTETPKNQKTPKAPKAQTKKTA